MKPKGQLCSRVRHCPVDVSKWDGNFKLVETELSAEAKREQAALQASIDQMRIDCIDLDAQNRALQLLIEREERLATHLREVLAASRAERFAIDVDKGRILSAPSRS